MQCEKSIYGRFFTPIKWRINKMGYSIAIDGPAGAGKSTIAKLISKKKGYIYVDTGAMYRAMALYFLEEGITPDRQDKISEMAKNAEVTITYENGEQIVWLNGRNVNGLIRTEEVGKMASSSSGNKDVRKKLVELQQALAERESVVMDGRDIGTCVLPNANVKVYLTADPHVRAVRRYDELVAKGQECDLDTIEKDIIERDYQDMHRELSPLKQAEDAKLLDSSNMTIEEVADAIIALCS
jgi:cytidylate kinase